MNFDWRKWQRLTAAILTQSLLISQACTFSLCANVVSANEANGKRHAKVFSATELQRVAALPSPMMHSRYVHGRPVTDETNDIDDTTGGETNSRETKNDNIPKKGLHFELSPGKPEQSPSVANPPGQAQVLSEEETNKLLKLLPPLDSEPAKKFLLPAKSLPPPNRQNRIELVFPPALTKSSPVAAAIRPLKITSKSPIGNVSQATTITANFSQPMVPVSTQSMLEAKTPPITFTPPVAGEWRWYGTQTLTFDPNSKKLPMATTYKMSVPAGTRSIFGGKLTDAETWTFATPSPQIIANYPDNSEGVSPTTLIMVRFDQQVNADAIIKLTKIMVGRKSFNAVLANKEEIAKDELLSGILKNVPAGSVVMFKSTEALPGNSAVSVSIGPDIPSAEGPLVTHKSSTFVFHTFGPFTVLPCTSDEKVVASARALTIRFSNQIDPKTADSSNIQITPAISDLKLNIWGSTISISGVKSPQTKYQVKLSDKLKDKFGQPLSGALKSLEFSVTHFDKQLLVPSDTTVFSSEQKTNFTITSMNINQVKMNIFAVKPADYIHFQRDRSDFVKHQKAVDSKSIKIKNVPDEITHTNIELDKWLDGRRGSLVVETTTADFSNQQTWDSICWVQCTNLGLDAIVDNQNVLAWTTELTTGAPVKGAKVYFTGAGKPHITDENGLATIPIPADMSERILVANSGKNSAFVGEPSTFNRSDTATAYHWYVISDRTPYRPGEAIRVKGILRRKILKPSEDLRLPQGFKSVSFTFTDSRGNEIGKGQTDLNQFGAFDLSFTLPPNVNLGNVNLNLTAINSTKKDDSAYYSLLIPVAEFRRPEFELKITNEGPSVQIVKGSTTLAATTNYFAGGNLAHTEIKWFASAVGSNYSPPGWDGYEFGEPKFPYFDFVRPQFNWATHKGLKGATDGSGKAYLHIDYIDIHPRQPSTLTVTGTVQDVNRQTWTDSTTLVVHPSEFYVGTKLEKSFAKKSEQLPLSLIVTNIDGKTQENIPIAIELYRSSGSYIGDKWVDKKDDVQINKTTSGVKPVIFSLKPNLSGLYKVKTTVLDPSGRGNETVNQFWVQGGEPMVEANPDAAFKVQKVMLLPEKKLYKPGESASILIQAPFAPANGVATVWHDGLAATIPLHMDETAQTISIPVDALDIPSMTVQVDLVGSDKKNKKLKEAPAEATGVITLDVSTDERALKVVATPDSENTPPGKEISIGVDVKDYKGRNLSNAEVTLAVVDDAVLALSNYRFKDPITTFYEKNENSPTVLREREKLDMTPFLSDAEIKKQRRTFEQYEQPMQRMHAFYKGGRGLNNGAGMDTMAMPMAVPMPGSAPPPPGGLVGLAVDPAFGQKNERSANLLKTFGSPISDTQFQILSQNKNNSSSDGNPPPIQMRSNFDALAKWAPSVVTDENGHASFNFKLPDNLTRYRVMAVASHGDNEFGSGESSITARLPLMVKPSAPRFLNYGDSFELPIVLHNQTDAPLEINLAARATNAEFTKGQGRHATIPANDRIEIRLPASTSQSGMAKFQVIAKSGNSQDAAQFDFPVYTPATTEAFATYGQIDNGAIAQAVETPKRVIPDFGSLELTTSTTVLETLTDAFLYLQRYPFECSEQLASRVISVALLKDMLKEFHVPGVPSEQECRQTVLADLQKLQSRQQPNGSFGLWKPDERETYPYVTLHVVHSLLLAKNAGYEVSQPMIDKALTYVKNIDNFISDYKGSARLDIKVQALYLRDLTGDTDIAAAHSLLIQQPIEKISSESLGLLLDIFAHKDSNSKDALAVETYLSNCVVETASTAEIVREPDGGGEMRYDYRFFDSPAKERAILLDSLISEGKSPELVTKLIRALFGGQVKGRWRNTQENVFVLLAMRHYFDKYEKTVPDLTAEAWLGGEFIGESSFKGRSADFKTISMPMNYLSQGATTKDFILKKSGVGRLYYRLGMNYAPEDLKLSAIDRGFMVTRTYEGVTKKDDVTKDADGLWKFKSGSLVKVKLKISAPSERFFVALVDPIPGGAEALNEDLNGTETPHPSEEEVRDTLSPRSRGGWSWWHLNWWNHENKRDNETEIFANQLQGGSHEYSYLLRATTPGVFVVPPTKAEEMYAPETFGRAQSERVIIE